MNSSKLNNRISGEPLIESDNNITTLSKLYSKGSSTKHPSDFINYQNKGENIFDPNIIMNKNTMKSLNTSKFNLSAIHDERNNKNNKSSFLNEKDEILRNLMNEIKSRPHSKEKIRKKSLNKAIMRATSVSQLKSKLLGNNLLMKKIKSRTQVNHFPLLLNRFIWKKECRALMSE